MNRTIEVFKITHCETNNASQKKFFRSYTEALKYLNTLEKIKWIHVEKKEAFEEEDKIRIYNSSETVVLTT